MSASKKRGQLAADRELAPIIKWAKDKPKAEALIAAAMSSPRRGEIYYRQEVALWLHPDPNRRKQPSFGTGLVLMEACKRLMEETP